MIRYEKYQFIDHQGHTVLWESTVDAQVIYDCDAYTEIQYRRAYNPAWVDTNGGQFQHAYNLITERLYKHKYNL